MTTSEPGYEWVNMRSSRCWAVGTSDVTTGEVETAGHVAEQRAPARSRTRTGPGRCSATPISGREHLAQLGPGSATTTSRVGNTLPVEQVAAARRPVRPGPSIGVMCRTATVLALGYVAPVTSRPSALAG